MNDEKGPSNKGVLRPPKRKPSGDPRRDAIESGPLRGRRAVTLGIVKAIREESALLSRQLIRFGGIEGKFARDRIRSIEHTLRILERVARLPADPATDYAAGEGGAKIATRRMSKTLRFPPREKP